MTRISEKLNLSNNIHYQSQILKNKEYCIQDYNSLITQHTNSSNLLYKHYCCKKNNENIYNKGTLNNTKSFNKNCISKKKLYYNLINNVNDSFKFNKNRNNESFNNNYNMRYKFQFN